MTIYQPSPTVPIGFHKAFFYVLLPIGIIVQLFGFFNVSVYLGAFGIILNLAVIGLMIATFVGFFKWTSWSYTTLFILLIVELIAGVILLILLIYLASLGRYIFAALSYLGVGDIIYSSIALLVISSIVQIGMSIFCLVYYSRRKLLFKGNPNMYQIIHPMGQVYGQQNYGRQNYGRQAYGNPQPQPRPVSTSDPNASTAPQAQAKRFCTRCGSKIEQDSKFCPKCGNSL